MIRNETNKQDTRMKTMYTLPVTFAYEYKYEHRLRVWIQIEHTCSPNFIQKTKMVSSMSKRNLFIVNLRIIWLPDVSKNNIFVDEEMGKYVLFKFVENTEISHDFSRNYVWSNSEKNDNNWKNKLRKKELLFQSAISPYFWKAGDVQNQENYLFQLF